MARDELERYVDAFANDFYSTLRNRIEAAVKLAKDDALKQREVFSGGAEPTDGELEGIFFGESDSSVGLRRLYNAGRASAVPFVRELTEDDYEAACDATRSLGVVPWVSAGPLLRDSRRAFARACIQAATTLPEGAVAYAIRGKVWKSDLDGLPMPAGFDTAAGDAAEEEKEQRALDGFEDRQGGILHCVFVPDAKPRTVNIGGTDYPVDEIRAKLREVDGE